MQLVAVLIAAITVGSAGRCGLHLFLARSVSAGSSAFISFHGSNSDFG